MNENGDGVMRGLSSKKYFTIGEVSKFCQVKDHVLRYWEKEIPTLSPKRRRGRRYYERDDVHLVQQIQVLMQEGYTLEGARGKIEGRVAAEQDTPEVQAIRQAVAELEAVVEKLKE